MVFVQTSPVDGHLISLQHTRRGLIPCIVKIISIFQVAPLRYFTVRSLKLQHCSMLLALCKREVAGGVQMQSV